MKGCSHILTEKDCEKLKYGKPGMCVDLLLNTSNKKATVLQPPTINRMLPPLYLEEIASKIMFEIHPVSDKWGTHYEYDSAIAQIAAHIEDYRSEVFDGHRRPAQFLEKAAKAVLQKAGTRDAALRWILLDEAPSGCRSLSQFLLEIAFPSC